MVLFQVNSPSVTIDPLKGDGPRPVHMDTVPFRFSLRAMEIKSRNIQIFKGFSIVQSHQASPTTLDQIGAYPTRVIFLEKPGQPFV
jgi:hypothetical protein